MSTRIRSARSGDGAAMGALSRAAFPPAMQKYLISTQPGIGRFWDVILAQPASFPSHRFLLAEDGAELLGLAEFRILGETGHLSHICVSERARGHGIGTRLIHEFVRRSLVTRMDLDVFDNNVSAVRLYERLGFTRQGGTAWLRHPLAAAEEARARLTFNEPHTSTAWFETFGFCELSGMHAGANFRAGRIGERLLRLFEPPDLADTSLISELARTFPEAGEVIAAVPEELVPEDSVLTPFMRATRMSAESVRTGLAR